MLVGYKHHHPRFCMYQRTSVHTEVCADLMDFFSLALLEAVSI